MYIEKVRGLMDAIAQEKGLSDEAANNSIESLSDGLGKFVNYFNAVYKDVIQAEVAMSFRDAGRIGQDKFEFMREQTDSRRRNAHDSAILACDRLNRLCDTFEVDHICPEKDADRYEVADFIGSFVSEVYQDGQHRNIDQAIDIARETGANPDKAYEPSNTMEKIASAETDREPKGAQAGPKETLIGILDKKGINYNLASDGIVINGSLDLHGMIDISELPANMTVNGNLNVANTNIAELPNGLTVEGFIVLQGTPIKELPEDLNLKGNMIAPDGTFLKNEQVYESLAQEQEKEEAEADGQREAEGPAEPEGPEETKNDIEPEYAD